MNFKKILPRKKVLSIDIGSYEIKVVEGKMTNKGIVIDKYFSFLTPEGAYENGYIIDKELLYYMLKEQLKNNKVSSDTVYMTIKSTAIITREVTIPYVEEEEINGILKFQLDEYLPMDPDKYVVQHKTIGVVEEDNVNKLNVLLIAIPKEIVESHFALLKELELKPTVLDFQSNGICKMLKYNSLINGRYDTQEITFAAIDLGFHNTNVTITKNNILQVSRIIEIGGYEMDMGILNFFEYTKDEVEEAKRQIQDVNRIDADYLDDDRILSIIRSSLEDIMDKIDLIFRYYDSREMGNSIQVILLYGGLSKIKGISNLFSSYFGIPAIVVSGFDKVFFSEDLNKYLNCVSSIIRIEELKK